MLFVVCFPQNTKRNPDNWIENVEEFVEKKFLLLVVKVEHSFFGVTVDQMFDLSAERFEFRVFFLKPWTISINTTAMLRWLLIPFSSLRKLTFYTDIYLVKS